MSIVIYTSPKDSGTGGPSPLLDLIQSDATPAVLLGIGSVALMAAC